MEKSIFQIPKMDCSAEEQLIRMKLGNVRGISTLGFDLPNRTLTIYHAGGMADIRRELESLGMGASQTFHEETTEPIPAYPAFAEKNPLLAAFAINAAFFVGELVTGLLFSSMGLVADSLDMLADAIVYGMSLVAVGGTMEKKKGIARKSGYFQFFLAIIGLIEVIRRFLLSEGMPEVWGMVGVSFVALIGNSVTWFILNKAKNAGEAHMKASLIFTSNDVKANLLVMASAGIVYLTKTSYPDLIAGTIIFFIVARGARQILKVAG